MTKIIAIDGPSASGKGTIARRIAEHFGFNYLNSGALYRLAAFLALDAGLDINDSSPENLNRIVEIFLLSNITFDGEKVWLENESGRKNIWPIISSEQMGGHAATISPYPPLRHAVKTFQRNQIRDKGLVAEGRDMTTEVFTDADVKIYLDATAEVRADRRYKEEVKKANAKSYEEILLSIKKRDEVDKNREVGALIIAPDAQVIDTSNLNRDEVFEVAKEICEKVLGKELRKELTRETSIMNEFQRMR